MTDATANRRGDPPIPVKPPGTVLTIGRAHVPERSQTRTARQPTPSQPPSAVRRVGALGDIHAEDALLEVALAQLRLEGADAIVAVGDIADGEGSVDRCCALLTEARAHVVRGNHERWLLAGVMRDLPGATRPDALSPESRAFLAALPATATIATIAGPLLLCHGLGENDMAGVRPDDHGYALASNDELHALVRAGSHALVVNGHTHRRMVRCFGELTVVNAGTLARAHSPTFALLDLAARRVRFWDLDPASGLAREAPAVALP
jgi:predicted phosphodiesterase